MSTVQFRVRPSEDRGNANHGWLRSFHTFSFADYYDPAHMQFGALRVINEDRVSPKNGFPPHSHANAEIFSYVISGALSHKDSMGNIETHERGAIQMTSGGKGIAHSEYNNGKEKETYFWQIWATPTAKNLQPKYYNRHFSDEEKTDKWAHIVAPVGFPGVQDARDGQGPTPIHSPLNAFATIASPGAKIEHNVVARLEPSKDGVKKVYLQVAQLSGFSTGPSVKTGKNAPLIKLTLGGQEASLGEGDGVFIEGAKVGDLLTLENTGDRTAEVLLFEMDA